MGTTYFGPYYEEIDTYRHEGYAARVMPDGTETSTFGGRYGRSGHVGYRARCGCGWSGSTVYPVPDDDPFECEQADLEWQRDHIDPMVEQARRTVWPSWQRQTAARAATVVEHVAAGRYRAAAEVLTALREDLDARVRTVEDLSDATGARGGEPR
ncbi:MAG: hypothetical protein ACRDT2_07740 [Natronosporangium sp.]